MYQYDKRAKYQGNYAAGLENAGIKLVKPEMKVIKTPNQARTVLKRKLKRFATLKNKLGV